MPAADAIILAKLLPLGHLCVCVYAPSVFSQPPPSCRIRNIHMYGYLPWHICSAYLTSYLEDTWGCNKRQNNLLPSKSRCGCCIFPKQTVCPFCVFIIGRLSMLNCYMNYLNILSGARYANIPDPVKRCISSRADNTNFQI